MKRRNTPAKKAILDILKSADSALSQDRIEAEVKGEMDRVTIYRVLNRFCEDGIAHKVLAEDGKYYFALCHDCTDDRHDHNHFHFRCIKCDKIECLDEKVAVKLPDGYKMENVTGWVTGYCAACS